jgi:hypothetical protein
MSSNLSVKFINHVQYINHTSTDKKKESRGSSDFCFQNYGNYVCTVGTRVQYSTESTPSMY